MSYDNFDNNCGCGRCNRRCCRGPQGQRGPQGPRGFTGVPGTSDTIEVRNTATGAAGTAARVIDVSGAPNHVLDFVIPQGPAGAAGAPGADGEADRINVAATQTGEAGTAAAVEDDFTMGVHNLTFTIPRGADAPISQLSIAQLYATSAQTLNATDQIFRFDINQNFRNSVTTQRTIQVLNAGTYKIEYGFVFTSVTDIVLSLYVNDLETANTRLTFNDALLHNSGVYLTMLNANDELSVRVQQVTGDAVLAENVLNGYLVVSPAG